MLKSFNMGKIIVCSSRKNVSFPVKFPSSLKIYPPEKLNKAPSAVVIFDYRVLEKIPGFTARDFPDKVFLLYAPSSRERERIVLDCRMSGFFGRDTGKHELDLKLNRAFVMLEVIEENQRLKEQVKYLLDFDQDTGCYNWRYFAANLPVEMTKAREKESHLSFIMFDIDYLRQINQGYGYEFADNILKGLVRLVEALLPPGTGFYRCRDDSFVIVLPGLSGVKAKTLANKIRSRVHGHCFTYNKNVRTHISISLGLVEIRKNSISNYRDVMLALESCLEISKRQGGNRLTIYNAKVKEDSELLKELKDVGKLRHRVSCLNKEINQTLLDIVFGFAKAIEVRDLSVAKHVEDVAVLARKIALKLKLPVHKVEDVYRAAILHDLGKIGITPQIIGKKGKLTKSEREIVQAHPWIAAEILREIHVLKGSLPAVLYHHERWDGTGYPLGLKGQEIPIAARIVALADVYEALISERSYRKAFSKKDALAIIKSERGKYFDPKIVDEFFEIVGKRTDK